MKLLKLLLLIFSLNISASNSTIDSSNSTVELKIIDSSIILESDIDGEKINEFDFLVIKTLLQTINRYAYLLEHTNTQANQYCITCGSYFAVFCTYLEFDSVKKELEYLINNFKKIHSSYKNFRSNPNLFKFSNNSSLNDIFKLVDPIYDNKTGKPIFSIVAKFYVHNFEYKVFLAFKNDKSIFKQILNFLNKF